MEWSAAVMPAFRAYSCLPAPSETNNIQERQATPVIEVKGVHDP